MPAVLSVVLRLISIQPVLYLVLPEKMHSAVLLSWNYNGNRSQFGGMSPTVDTGDKDLGGDNRVTQRESSFVVMDRVSLLSNYITLHKA